MIDKNVVTYDDYIGRAKKPPSGMIYFYLNKKTRLIERHRLILKHKPKIKTIKTYKEFLKTLENLKNLGWRVIYDEREKRRILECLV